MRQDCRPATVIERHGPPRQVDLSTTTIRGYDLSVPRRTQTIATIGLAALVTVGTGEGSLMAKEGTSRHDAGGDRLSAGESSTEPHPKDYESPKGSQLSISQLVIPITSIVVSGLIGFFALRHSRRTSQEPWIVTFRELHREFWNDQEIARVRAWLCCDEAYEREVRPVLQKRAVGQVSADEYKLLEVLDRFCALMVRAVFMQTSLATARQKEMFKRMGYRWWLKKLMERPDIATYVERNWENLHPQIGNAASVTADSA